MPAAALRCGLDLCYPAGMAETSPSPMTVDEFLVWAEGRPGRYELDGGTVVAMSPESDDHRRAKAAVHDTIAAAVRRAGLPCEALSDGVTVRVDARSAYTPDVAVYCGSRLPIMVSEPVIVVEVLSVHTTGHRRCGELVGYFAVRSLQHYIIVDAERCAAIHHARRTDEIATRILHGGTLRLDPPGLELRIEDLFGAEPADEA